MDFIGLMVRSIPDGVLGMMEPRAQRAMVGMMIDGLFILYDSLSFTVHLKINCRSSRATLSQLEGLSFDSTRRFAADMVSNGD